MIFGEVLVPVNQKVNSPEFYKRIAAITSKLNTEVTMLYSPEDPTEILRIGAMGYISGMEGEFIDRQNKENEAIWKQIQEIAADYPNFRTERMVGKLFESVIARSALSDLVIVDGKEMAANREAYKNAEIAFVNSRVPILVLGNEQFAGFKHVAIAWNGSPQAARAVKAALPFLRNAGKVSIIQLVKNGTGKKPQLFNPEFIQETLKRHGVTTDVIYGKQQTADVAEDLLNLARANQVDTIVAGLFSTSRATEILLGGTSKTLLRKIGKLNFILSH